MTKIEKKGGRLNSLTALIVQSLQSRNCSNIDRYLKRRLERVLRSVLLTLQTEIRHKLYHSDETVKIYDCKVIADEWRHLRAENDIVRAVNVFGHLFFEFLYKGNQVSKLRSAVRVRPLAMEAIIEFMLERCPADRLGFCQRVNASCLSLYHKTLIISQHIPEFRPHWFCDRPKWQDDQIEVTFDAYCMKREVQLALNPEDQ